MLLIYVSDPHCTCKMQKEEVPNCSHFNNLVITVAISLKLGIQLGTHQAMHSHVLRLGEAPGGEGSLLD